MVRAAETANMHYLVLSFLSSYWSISKTCNLIGQLEAKADVAFMQINGANEVRASQLAQASERVGSPIPASQQG